MTLPVYILLLAWVVDGSWLVYQSSVVEGAAQYGCRAGAIIDPGQDDISLQNVLDTAEDVMLEEVAALGGACHACSATASVGGTPPERILVCKARNGYDPLFGLLNPTTLEGSAMRRLEWQR